MTKFTKFDQFPVDTQNILNGNATVRKSESKILFHVDSANVVKLEKSIDNFEI